MFCPNCRKELPDGTKFCGGCGTPIAVNQAPTAPVQPVTPVKPVVPVRPAAPAAEAPVAAPVKPAAKGVDVKGILGKVTDTVKKIPSKYLKIGAIALVALLVIILAVNLFGGDKVPNYALYVKDEQLYYNKLGGKEGSQVTDDLDRTTYSGQYKLTDDGKKLFYIDDGDTLFYRNTSNMKKDPVELDSNVSYFFVSENGKLVTYVKNGDLYQHNLKKEEKIIKDLESFPLVSPDGKIIYFQNEDGDYICWRNGKEEEIDDDISIEYISEDYKTIIYTKDDEDILVKKVGKKPKEIATDIAGMTNVTRDGTFYYLVNPEGDMSDYFDDDDLSGEMTYLRSIYYYNGSKAKLVADNAFVQNSFSAYNRNGLYYVQFGDVEEGSLSYDDLMDLYEEEDMTESKAMIELLTEASGKSNEYIAIEGKTAKVEFEEEVYSLYLSNDGKSIYALTDVEYKEDEDSYYGSYEGTLLKASVSGNKVKSFKEVDSGVSTEQIGGFLTNYAYYGHNKLLEDNYSSYFVYFKDIEEGHGELYVNGELAAEDVYADEETIRYNVGENAVMFYTDYKDGAATLNMYNGKKSVEVSEDVYGYVMHENGDIALATDRNDKGEFTLSIYSGKVKEVAQDVVSYHFTADGDILYLTEYNQSKGKGDLGLYTGKAKIIDEDVTQILDVYDCDDI